MKHVKKLIVLSILSYGIHQTHTYDKSADDAQPTHQGLGRFSTAIENTLTLHPGNAVNSLATGDQSDTTFGWHKDKKGRVKANRAHTRHNNNKTEEERQAYRDQDHSETGHQRLYKDERDQKNSDTTGHWFWKKEKNRKSSTEQSQSDNQSKPDNQQPNNVAKKTKGHWFWKKTVDSSQE